MIDSTLTERLTLQRITINAGGLLAMVAVAAAVLLACEAAPPTTTPTTPTTPAAPAAPAAPTTPAAPGGSGGGSPALPSVVGNIVFEINAGAAPARSSSIASLPPIDGTRQEATIISETIRKNFPDDFTYNPTNTYLDHPWELKADAPSITQDWLDNGGIVIPSFSLNGGSVWLSPGFMPQLSTLYQYGRNESGGYVMVEMAGIGVLAEHVPSSYARYACTTTETNHHLPPTRSNNYLSSNGHRTEQVGPAPQSWPADLPHHPTMTITEGAATATAEATIANGVITAVGNIQHGSGTFTGTNIAYTWGTFWREPQRGSGATFTFTVSSGQVTAVGVTNGGTGYRKPCNAANSYTEPSYYYDKTEASYGATAYMRAALRIHGTEPLLIRFAIISP